MENNTYMVYRINLETGKVSETGSEFEYASDAQHECDFNKWDANHEWKHKIYVLL